MSSIIMRALNRNFLTGAGLNYGESGQNLFPNGLSSALSRILIQPDYLLCSASFLTQSDTFFDQRLLDTIVFRHVIHEPLQIGIGFKTAFKIIDPADHGVCVGIQ